MYLRHDGRKISISLNAESSQDMDLLGTMRNLLDLLKIRKRTKPARLNSKNVRWVTYSPDAKRLTVWNSAGRKTVHEGVSEGVYEKLLAADPPDFFYETYIAEAAQPKSALIRWLALTLIVALALTVVFWDRLLQACCN